MLLHLISILLKNCNIVFSTGKVVMESQIPVNLVHRNDVIDSIVAIIKSNKGNQIYNICYPHHPSLRLTRQCQTQI